MAALPSSKSMEDLVTGLFGPTASFSRLGRSPSEAEFAQFLSAGAAAAGMEGGGEGNPLGMHRVASIDLLRRLIMNQQAAMVQAGGEGGEAGARAAVAEQLAAAGLRTQMSNGIAGVFGGSAAAPFPPLPASGWPVQAPEPATAAPAPVAPPSSGRPSRQPPPKKEPVRGARERRAAPKSRRARSEEEEEEEEEEMDEGEVLKSMGKGPFTAEEIRRQRRMLSNRESARRSRRRKLEHVHTLQQQIDALRADLAGAAERLREAEQRGAQLLRENAALRAELGGGEPSGGRGRGARAAAAAVPRVPSSELLARREVGAGEEPRGFVPFRSLKSYENLLKLQAAAEGTLQGAS